VTGQLAMTFAFPQTDPLVRAQGGKQRQTRLRIIVIAACLLHAATISMNQILMGALIGFPNCRLSTEPNVCQNLHLNWGTRKTRTRGSVWRIDKIASD
jgi:hypothetical protein